MCVISAPPPATDADILEAFRHQLMARDLAPATAQAYLDLREGKCDNTSVALSAGHKRSYTSAARRS
jgi:hypothetical protein